MPKAKERKPDDKIKNQGKRKSSKPVQDQARRVMTAKMRKELAQQKRSVNGSTGETVREDSPTAEAVEQVEQTAGAVIQEAGQRTKQGISRAVTTAKQERRKIKERQDQPKGKDLPPETPASKAPEAPETPAPEMPDVPAPRPDRPAPREQASRTPPRSRPQPPSRTGDGPAVPKERPAPVIRSKTPKTRPERGPEALAIPKVRPADTPADPPVPKTRTAKARPTPDKPLLTEPWTADKPSAPPTPGERMREWAVDKRRKQAQEHGEVPASPECGEPSPVSHYGKSPVTPGSSTTPKTAPSLENQSIYPSIKERPRSSAILKEKAQGWTITPRTRRSVEQAAGSTAIPPKAPAPVGKKTTVKRLTERMRQKAKAEAQQAMAQSTKRTAKAAADLSRKAATATARAVKSLIGALSTLSDFSFPTSHPPEPSL